MVDHDRTEDIERIRKALRARKSRMKAADFLELLTLFVTSFPREPVKSGELWLLDVCHHEYGDVEQGINQLRRSGGYVNAAALIECVSKAKADRLRRDEMQQRMSRTALPAGTVDVEARAAMNKARAREMVAKLTRKSAMPAETKQQRASGPAQTPEQAEARRAELQRQAERLLEREAMRDAFSEGVSEDDGGAR